MSPPPPFRTRGARTDAPYLLYVGSRSGHKNFKGLLDAYSASPWLRKNFFLLCFGGGPFSAAEQAALAASASLERVRYLGGSDAVLAACYAHAALFVCPSFYEGFGIPLLEAMSLDCPVACSNSSSLPEVAGDAARLFDPRRSRIHRRRPGSGTDFPGDGRTAHGNAVAFRRNQFSWRRCAQTTLDIYQRLWRAVTAGVCGP